MAHPALIDALEAGVRAHPLDRALILLHLAEPETEPESLATLSIARRNHGLAGLRTQLFGSRLSLFADCPACTEPTEFDIDLAALPREGEDVPVDIDGHRFHPPSTRDLAVAMEARDAEDAAMALLRACAEHPDKLPTGTEAEALIDAAGQALDAVNPWADLRVEIACPSCSATSDVVVDLAALLWDELESEAGRIFNEVHILARAYGWREDEILAMSPWRRAAYLARVEP